MNKIPWQKLFKISVIQLGISPSEFWGLTLKELQYLLTNETKDIFSQDDLEKLQSIFPDKIKGA
jgi:hypothetical protein